MDLSPALTAALDQQQASLAEAIGRVREHRTTCTITRNVCPGTDVMRSIQLAHRHTIESLLGLALCALAADVDTADAGIHRLLSALDAEDKEGNG